MQLEETIKNVKKQVEIAEVFVLKYDAKLPEGLGSLMISNEGVQYFIHLTGKTDDDRQRALSVLGDVFGRSDWSATATYNRRGYDWGKRLDGVRLHIFEAQKTDEPDSFPVDPKQFPLQLEDATA